MADLDPLIRYRKNIVDEKRKYLAQLYREAEQLTRQKDVVLAQMEKEKALAAEMGNVEAAAYLGRYLEGARRKVRAIEQSMKKMETRIIAAQEDMRTAFAEMKKVDIVQRNRKAEEKAEQKKKEDTELAEIAIENYRRRLEEDES